MKAALWTSLFALPLLAHAGIEFESTSVKVTVGPEDEAADFIYKFKVTGDKPVRITGIEVSCGCMEASSAKSEYAPGETGEVKVIMKVGSVEGEMLKPTTVTTNDPKNQSIQLDATVNVPKIYEFTPMTTSWNMGDEPVTKILTLKVLSKDPINVLKYASTRENMAAEMTVVKPGREYQIKLTPKSTAQPELGLLTIETDCKIAKYTRRQAFFTIVRKPNPTPPAAPTPTAPK